MCQIDEKKSEVKEPMECKCNKQICCKMQSNSLRCAIDSLKNYSKRLPVIATLNAIGNLLQVYTCFPCTCLLERIKWACTHIENNDKSLTEEERINVLMIIAEFETFLDDN